MITPMLKSENHKSINNQDALCMQYIYTMHLYWYSLTQDDQKQKFLKQSAQSTVQTSTSDFTQCVCTLMNPVCSTYKQCTCIGSLTQEDQKQNA